MKKILRLLLCAVPLLGMAQDPAPCTDLFISEYIEGTSNNKALELYNPTSSPVNLTAYSIKIYFNGSSTAGATFLPQGTLNAGQTFTIAHASGTIFTSPDTTLGGVSVVSFNGNDAVQLIHGSTVIDVIGIVGVDPITNWPVGSGATNEFTLVRKAAVHNGYTNWTGSADTSYDVYPQNTVSFFGSHTIDPCPALPLNAAFTFTSVCQDDTTAFTNTTYGGTGPYMWFWDFGDASTSTQQNPTHFYPVPGCYTVTLIVVDGMAEDDTISHLVCVTPYDDPMVTTTDSVLCNDSFGMFLNSDDSTGGVWTGTFVSDSGGGDGFFSSASIAPGTYTAVYTTNGSCHNADTVYIYVPVPPTSSFTYTTAGATLNFTSTSTNASTYDWDFGGAGNSTAPNPSFTFPGSGPYNVCLEVVSDSGCTALSCQTITITGLNDVAGYDAVNMYPNPAGDYFTLDAEPHQPVCVKDLSGRIVMAFTTRAKKTTVDVRNLPVGVYSVTLAGQKTYKLVLAR